MGDDQVRHLTELNGKLEAERDALRKTLAEADAALEAATVRFDQFAREGHKMDDVTCGMRSPGVDACMRGADWYGSFLIGGWLCMVPLCGEHVRAFRLMGEAYKRAHELSGGAVTNLQFPVKLMEEIYSLTDNSLFGTPKLVWKCSECELPIVRSLESGKWVLAGGSEERTRVELSLAMRPHEHTPG